MITVIGLGSAGCNIAEMFEGTENINVLLIDSEIEGDNCFSLPSYNTPEEYERYLPNLDSFLSSCTKKVLFLVGGSGKVSGAGLKILSYIKDREISVIYIRPDRNLLGTTGLLQDRVTFNVFQEYARSGLFKSIYLIDNLNIENLLGDTPVVGYYEKLNKVIYDVVSSAILLDNTKPVMSIYSSPKEISRICTFGLYDIENNIEKLFYDVDMVDDVCYNFFINNDALKNDGKLFKNIKDRMKEKVSSNTKTSYRIFSTVHEQNYCFMTLHSKMIQG